jgi:hypothetical protein
MSNQYQLINGRCTIFLCATHHYPGLITARIITHTIDAVIVERKFFSFSLFLSLFFLPSSPRQKKITAKEIKVRI